jgi:hypothetical protein
LLAAIIIILLIMVVAEHGRHENRQANLTGSHGFMHRGNAFIGKRGFGDNQNRLHGTVTAVNGSGFTVAGNGAVTQVQTSSSTQYHGGNQVKVNDTVVASGTTSDGSFQATDIVINP